jgi:putative restriction endonuclease
VERDDELRAACFLALDVLCAQYGDEMPYQGVLDQGFRFGAHRVAFLTRMRGIYRARQQQGPAALSVNTSFKSPYNDEATDDGFLYAYQAGPLNNADNQWLHMAYELQVPLVYFWGGVRPGWYRPVYPCFVHDVFPLERRVLLAPGEMKGLTPEPPDTVIEQRYIVRETKVRLHQGRFRGAVLLAYRDSCAVCRLKEVRLLDAAHITADAASTGPPVVTNGLCMCSIHHRAFDKDLVGIAPDYRVHVSSRLLEEEDGPMLETLKDAHGQSIELPRRRREYPDPNRLAERFERFEATSR